PRVAITAAPSVDDDIEAEDEDEDEDEIRDLDYDDDDDEVFGVASCIEVESIVKDRPKTPKLFDAVMEAIRPDSKVKHYFSRSQSFSSRNHSLDGDYLMPPPAQPNAECKIKLEDTDILM